MAALEARLDHERRFPAEWANRRVRDRFGDRVLAGPFALVPGVTALVRERFAATHEIEQTPAQERFVGDFPQLGEEIPLVTRQLTISEFRDRPSGWLAMTPR